MGRYQNSRAGTGTFDIKVLSQVGRTPLPPVEFHEHFGEDMLLGGGVFDGIGVLLLFKKAKRYN